MVVDVEPSHGRFNAQEIKGSCYYPHCDEFIDGHPMLIRLRVALSPSSSLIFVLLQGAGGPTNCDRHKNSKSTFKTIPSRPLRC